jgi:hypothetical protein
MGPLFRQIGFYVGLGDAFSRICPGHRTQVDSVRLGNALSQWSSPAERGVGWD